VARAVLCGSVNLATADDVFRTVASISEGSIERFPDGETGERALWVQIQIPRIAAMPQFERVADLESYGNKARFRLRDGADTAEMRFDLGYAEVAADSYRTFATLKKEGAIAAHSRFQVSLPTVMAVATSYIEPASLPLVVPALERSLLGEVEAVVAAVPADELAIQWDVAAEMALVEGFVPNPYAVDPGPLLDQVARLGNAVPSAAELGFHLCYGDAPGEDGQGHHFMEPADTSKLVLVANGLAERVTRPISWVHMPVPIERNDDAYFAPLADLVLPEGAELYLGLVHHEDGLEGAQRRADTASQWVRGFGVATECGMGRVPREFVPEILRVQTLVRVS
jgi:hypothetical protein